MLAAIDEGEQTLARRGIAPANAQRERPACRFTPRCDALWANEFRVSPESVVTVTLAQGVNGRRLTVSPTIEGSKVVGWRCSSDVEPLLWLPPACRGSKST